MKTREETALFICLQSVAAGQMEGAAQLLKQHGLTSPQFNALRILRGAGEPLSCSELGNRMWTRDSDITRLLDRLEKRGWVRRSRSKEDRRALQVGITEKGLDLLASLDEPVETLHRQQFASLTQADRKDLGRLLKNLANPS